MGDPPPHPDEPDTRIGPGVGPEPVPITGAPRWAKVFGIIALVVVVLFVILLLAGGGEHGPVRHMPSDDGPGDTPSSSVVEHLPAAGGHAPS